MKIIVTGSFKYSIYAPAFASGFASLGHLVESVHEEDYLSWESRLGKLYEKIQVRTRIGYKVVRYNKELLSKVETFKPDMVFLYRCYFVWPSTIKKIQEQGTKVFSYNNDDPFSKVLNNWEHRYFHASIPIVDVNLVYRKKNILDFKKAGAKEVELMLPYYLEKENSYEKIPDTIPIAFIGHFEDDGRDQYIKALMDAGLQVSIYDSGWQKSSLYKELRPVMKPAVYSSQYNHELNKCQIALVFLSKLNCDTYTRRCFEIPATKTLMLSEYTDDLNALFPDNECAVYFRTKEELVERCRELLSTPQRIAQIAENGYKRVHEIGGSEVDRCRQITELYQKLFN